MIDNWQKFALWFGPLILVNPPPLPSSINPFSKRSFSKSWDTIGTDGGRVGGGDGGEHVDVTFPVTVPIWRGAWDSKKIGSIVVTHVFTHSPLDVWSRIYWRRKAKARTVVSRCGPRVERRPLIACSHTPFAPLLSLSSSTLAPTSVIFLPFCILHFFPAIFFSLSLSSSSLPSRTSTFSSNILFFFLFRPRIFFLSLFEYILLLLLLLLLCPE